MQGFRPVERGHLYRLSQKLNFASPGSGEQDGSAKDRGRKEAELRHIRRKCCARSQRGRVGYALGEVLLTAQKGGAENWSHTTVPLAPFWGSIRAPGAWIP